MTSDPTPAAAEARATKATGGDVNAALVELLHGLLERALNIAHSLALPPPEAKATCRWPDCGCGTSPSAQDFCDEKKPVPEAKDGAAPSPETGWRLVPVEPTDTMLHAATLIAPTWDDRVSHAKWSAMLAAAPAAPSPDLAALEELAGQLERAPDTHWDRRFGDALRAAILHLKAQINAGPSADGGKDAGK